MEGNPLKRRLSSGKDEKLLPSEPSTSFYASLEEVHRPINRFLPGKDCFSILLPSYKKYDEKYMGCLKNTFVPHMCVSVSVGVWVLLCACGCVCECVRSPINPFLCAVYLNLLFNHDHED